MAHKKAHGDPLDRRAQSVIEKKESGPRTEQSRPARTGIGING